MRSDYYITRDKGEIDLRCATDRLVHFADLIAPAHSTEHGDKSLGRSPWTQTLDACLVFISRHARPLHWLGRTCTAVILYLYARAVALTARIVTSGEASWPNVEAPSVVALWHGDAPSLLVAFAKRRSKAPAVILVATDPRGDYLALLCRMLGFDVVRASGIHGDWRVLIKLAEKLQEGAWVIITPDGGGPARVAKIGAVALAAATGVPLIPLATNCYPAIQQTRKWDAARNPVPFSRISVWIGSPHRFQPFDDRDSMEGARRWLEETLNRVARTP